MNTTEWTINKNLKLGDEFKAAGHTMRIVAVNDSSNPDYNRCEVEDLGALKDWPSKGETAPPLKFGGAR